MLDLQNIESGITRRSFLAAAMLGGAALAIPKSAFALEPDEQGEIVRYMAYPGMTETEIDEILMRQAEEEAAAIIAEAERNSGSQGIATRGRPKYSTVYGPTYDKYSGWNDVPGQPQGGVRIGGGGFAYVSKTGGGSVSVSVPLPNGLGSIGVSIPIAKHSRSVTGYGVNIPGDGHFHKVISNTMHKVRPFVVYEEKDGKKRVYSKKASNIFYSLDLRTRRVK